MRYPNLWSLYGDATFMLLGGTQNMAVVKKQKHLSLRSSSKAKQKLAYLLTYVAAYRIGQNLVQFLLQSNFMIIELSKTFARDCNLLWLLLVSIKAYRFSTGRYLFNNREMCFLEFNGILDFNCLADGLCKWNLNRPIRIQQAKTTRLSWRQMYLNKKVIIVGKCFAFRRHVCCLFFFKLNSDFSTWLTIRRGQSNFVITLIFVTCKLKDWNWIMSFR